MTDITMQHEEEQKKVVAHDAGNTASYEEPVQTNDAHVSTITTSAAAAAAAAEASSQGDATKTNGNNKRPVQISSEQVNGNIERNNKKQRVSESSSSPETPAQVPEVIDLSSPTVQQQQPPPPPPPSEQQNGKSSSDATTSANSSDLPQVTKSRGLSKWAARLLEPNRPRSLIETPQEIPLNDEFLKAFGQREREHDRAMGRDKLEIDHAIADDDDDDEIDGDEEDSLYAGVDEAAQSLAAASKTEAAGAPSGSKIKISNIKFTTTEASLTAACQRYGPVASVKLLMNKDDDAVGENAGRAFVAFENAASATACLENLKTLDGRPLRIDVAANKAPNFSSSGGGGLLNGAQARYWERNIRTKCFKCGGVGHVEADCENKAMAKPCPLCAQTNHTIRNCPVKSVCYNCGIPGHVSRDCMQQRNLPPRRICTICYQTDHTKEVCRNGFTAAQSYNAECMVCYERGHHLCKEMKWARGHQLSQQGVSCFNCGQTNHVGSVCSQPKLDDCSRDEALAIHLVEMATKFYEDERNRNAARGGIANSNNNNGGGGGGRQQRGGGRASLGGVYDDRNYPSAAAARGRQANQDFEFDRRRNRSMPPMKNAGSQQPQQNQRKQPPGVGDRQRGR